MAEDAEDLREETEETEGEDGGESEGRKGKKTLLIVIGTVMVLVVGGIAGAWFAGFLDPVVAMITGAPAAEGTAEEEAPDPADVVFLDLPEILVTLNTSGRKESYLKIVVALELQTAKDVPRVQAMMTRVLDTFNVYLRELRVEDLKGSAGMYRLREELLRRVNAAVAPVPVNDVLFKTMIVQG